MQRVNYSTYSPADLARAKQFLTEDLLRNATRSVNRNPVAMLIGGQPASGKTRLIETVKALVADDAVVINGDNYRNLHPCYDEIQQEYGPDAPHHTQPFSNALVEFMKAECLQQKLNFIIEGTMRTHRVIKNTAVEARKHGFRVEAHVLAIAEEDSYLGIFQRYEGEMSLYGVGRFSPLETHDEAYRQIPVNLQ